MRYIQILLFLAFALLLWVFPVFLYKNRRFRKAWLGLAYSEKYRLFVARVLSLVLLLFHMVYFALFPHDTSIIISSLYVFFSLASRKNLKMLMALRRTKLPLILLSLLAMFWAFFPDLLSVSITIAFIVEAAYCLPDKPKGINTKRILRKIPKEDLAIKANHAHHEQQTSYDKEQ